MLCSSLILCQILIVGPIAPNSDKDMARIESSHLVAGLVATPASDPDDLAAKKKAAKK